MCDCSEENLEKYNECLCALSQYNIFLGTVEYDIVIHLKQCRSLKQKPP